MRDDQCIPGLHMYMCNLLDALIQCLYLFLFWIWKKHTDCVHLVGFSHSFYTVFQVVSTLSRATSRADREKMSE